MKIKSKGPSEDVIQAHCVRWFRNEYPKSIIYAVPNGGKRHIKIAMKLKLTGVLAGVPDLAIPEPNGPYHGAFIEMKSAIGKATEDQKKILEYLKSRNYFTAICKSLDQFKSEVKGYMEQDELSDSDKYGVNLNAEKWMG